jgi:prepilin-type N-terminal cleavage/methylation domain-containing protein
VANVKSQNSKLVIFNFNCIRKENLNSHQFNKNAFSLIELLVVIFLIGFMAVLGVPRLTEVLYQTRINAEAQKIASIFRLARSKAANTQKPIRVSFDCIAHFASVPHPPCTSKTETAVFINGELDHWTPIREGSLELADYVNIQARGSSLEPVSGSRLDDNIIWVVFTPDSHLFSSFSSPINLAVWYGNTLETNGHLISLNSASARVTVAKRS